jgi:hypothetical protein
MSIFNAEAQAIIEAIKIKSESRKFYTFFNDAAFYGPWAIKPLWSPQTKALYQTLT